MSDNQEWKEIEKSVEKFEEKRKNQYKGLDIVGELQNKKENLVLKKILKSITIIITTLVIIFAIWVLLKLYIFVKMKFTNMYDSHNVDVKSSIEKGSDLKIELISKDVDEREVKRPILFQNQKIP